MSMSSGNNDQPDVEQLLALVGPRDAVPAARLERMRAAVHSAWEAETKPRATRQVLWTLVTAAAAAAIVISIVRTLPDAAKPAEPPAVATPVHVRTGPAERRSLLLAGGGELRVDVSSVLTIHGSEIRLTRGALYLDSKGTTLPAVITPAGRITNIGTRFEVRLVGGSTRVRVRDGRVRLTQASTVSEVGAAEELLARADASTARRRVARFGAEWAWVTRAAPRFEVEGKSLGVFLDWVEKEGAWSVAFAPSSLARRARTTVLHGSIEDMSTTEALEVILRASGLDYRVDMKTGRVVVFEEGAY